MNKINKLITEKKETFTHSLILNDEEINNYPKNIKQLEYGEKKLDSYFKEENGTLYLYLDESFLERLFNNFKYKRGSKKLLNTETIVENNKIIYKYEVIKNKESNVEHMFFEPKDFNFPFTSYLDENSNMFNINCNTKDYNKQYMINDLGIIRLGSKNFRDIFSEGGYTDIYTRVSPLYKHITLKLI